MNGRVYDPELGRFLSPDPFVQFPESTQGYNRYAYVANNPLSYNDPSGHFIQFFIAADMIAAGGVSAVGGALMAAGSIASAAKGYAAGGLNGMFKSVVAGGVTVGITYGMATGLSAGVTTNGVTTANTLGPIAKAGLIGLGGGMASKAGGGRFGDGFLGGVAGSLTDSYLPESWQDGVHGIIVQTMVGGTVSSLGGGKFANGAVSAFVIAIAGAPQRAADAAQALDLAERIGVSAGLTDEQVKDLAANVRRSLAAAKLLARKGLDGYCGEDPDRCAGGLTSADFDGVTISESRKNLFIDGQSKRSDKFAGGAVDSSLAVAGKRIINIYAGGLALQGKGTNALAVAEVLLHEFFHTSQVGANLSEAYKKAVSAKPPWMPKLDYDLQPHEIGATRFATEVMRYVR